MHMRLKFVFKWALHFSTLVLKLFNSGIKIFQATIINATLWTSLLLNASPPVRHTYF